MMRNIVHYIIEKITINDKSNISDKPSPKITPKVYSSKSGKELTVKFYCNDKFEWENFESTYSHLVEYNLIKYSKMYLCKYEDKKWIAQVDQTYSINHYQPNYRYFYSSKQNYCTYNQLMEMLDSRKYMIILTDKK